MEEKAISEKESLAVITEMIARTRRRYLGSGNVLLMWGYLVVIVTASVWTLLALTRNESWNWLWFAIPVVGWPVMAAMLRKERGGEGVVTYSDKVTSRMWAIFGLSELVLAIVCLCFAWLGDIDCWAAMLVYTMIAAPCAEVAQGLVVKESSLVWGGLAGLAVSIVTVTCVCGGIPLRANWYMPLFILSWVMMMIVPGHVINRKAKSEP